MVLELQRSATLSHRKNSNATQISLKGGFCCHLDLNYEKEAQWTAVHEHSFEKFKFNRQQKDPELQRSATLSKQEGSCGPAILPPGR
jgi:hypothetical protein